MNREILFRGRSVIGRKWIEGYYVYDTYQDKHYIYYNTDMDVYGNIDIVSAEGLYPELTKEEVGRDTVRQYTGSKDIQGSKIFEGHVLQNGLRENLGTVYFKNGMFLCGRKPYIPNRICNEFISSQCVKIIGNIHEKEVKE